MPVALLPDVMRLWWLMTFSQYPLVNVGSTFQACRKAFMRFRLYDRGGKALQHAHINYHTSYSEKHNV